MNGHALAQKKPDATKFSYTIWGQGLITQQMGNMRADASHGPIVCATYNRTRTCKWE
jgi:hypothetical protein